MGCVHSSTLRMAVSRAMMTADGYRERDRLLLHVCPYYSTGLARCVCHRFVNSWSAVAVVMDSEQVERDLRDALGHLYDPLYQPSEALYDLTGASAAAGPLGVQSALLEAIDGLKPTSDTPAASRLGQVYELLRNRFVLKLTLDETAERMHLSLSTAWRAQRAAVHTLAQFLWRQRGDQPEGGAQHLTAGDYPAHLEAPDGRSDDWHLQIESEVAALRAHTPDVRTDVGEMVQSVVASADVYLPEGLSVEVKHIQGGLVAAVHPVVLRQILVSGLRRLALHAQVQDVALYAGLENGNVKITLTGATLSDGAATGGRLENLLADLPVPQGLSVGGQAEGASVFLWVEAPSVGQTTVLVVDDNPDIIRLYQRATEGTRFRIVALSLGQMLFETLQATAPDVIVLDVMLPDVDGWQLLMRLREDRSTRHIPVIVCTVVRDEDLALSLGAARYLPKPVRPRAFIEALEQVTPAPSASAPRSSASSPAAC